MEVTAGAKQTQTSGAENACWVVDFAKSQGLARLRKVAKRGLLVKVVTSDHSRFASILMALGRAIISFGVIPTVVKSSWSLKR
jgi:hypothetical protein